MTGVIDNKDFATLLKQVFIRTLAFKFKEHQILTPSIKYFRILRGDPSQREIDMVKQIYDPRWIEHLQVNKQAFVLSSDSIPKPL